MRNMPRWTWECHTTTMKTNDADILEERQNLSAGDLEQAAHCELAAGMLKRAAQDLQRFHKLFFGDGVGVRSSLVGELRQHQGRFQSAPATHGLFVRLAERPRSITSATNRGLHATTKQSRPPRGNWRTCSSSRMQLRTEQVVSFADVCCAKTPTSGF